jgi:hypothetical protein
MGFPGCEARHKCFQGARLSIGVFMVRGNWHRGFLGARLALGGFLGATL